MLRVLVLSRSQELRADITGYLCEAGHDAVAAAQPGDAAAARARRPPDAVIVHVRPGTPEADAVLDGLADADVPLLLLVEQADEVARTLALEMGAADVVGAPADRREVEARLMAALRARGHAAERLRFRSATADLRSARILHDDGRIDRLSAGDVALLRTLARARGGTLDRGALITSAPAEDREALDRAIDARIARLRRKLGAEAIETVRGLGYRLAAQ